MKAKIAVILILGLCAVGCTRADVYKTIKRPVVLTDGTVVTDKDGNPLMIEETTKAGYGYIITDKQIEVDMNGDGKPDVITRSKSSDVAEAIKAARGI